MWREDSSNHSGRLEKSFPASLGIPDFFLNFIFSGFPLRWQVQLSPGFLHLRKSLESRAGKTKHGNVSVQIPFLPCKPNYFPVLEVWDRKENFVLCYDFWAVAAGLCVLGCVNNVWVELQTILCWKRCWAPPGDVHSWLEFKNDRLLKKTLWFYHFLPSRCWVQAVIFSENFHREMRFLEQSSCCLRGPRSHLGCEKLQCKPGSENRSEPKSGISRERNP